MQNELIPQNDIENRIFVFRNQKVMLDKDLAELYKVETKRLNEAVKRNIKRFPPEFMFQLNESEKQELVTNCDRLKTLIHSTSCPYAFTEHGVVMLASVLKSDRAAAVNVEIVRAFIKLREFALEQKEIIARLSDLEKQVLSLSQANGATLNDHEQKINQILTYIKYLQTPQEPKKPIGYNVT